VRPVVAKLAMASLLVNLLGLATPLFMMLVLNRVIGHGAPDSVVPMMAVLSVAMLAVYALDFSLRVARGWLSARAGRAPRHVDERRSRAPPGAASLPSFRAHAVGRHRRAPAAALCPARLLHRPDAGVGHRPAVRRLVPGRGLCHQHSARRDCRCRHPGC